MERWRIEENGGRLFRRPKLTLSCSAEGKEGRNIRIRSYVEKVDSCIGMPFLIYS
jgi:hypothetical protein